MTLPIHRPALMGILNVTPDSFSDGGRYTTPQDAVDAALKMLDEGADLIDIGGESTRPGSQPVPLEEEIARVIPVVELLARHQVSISVDTTKWEVAEAALQSGAKILNDITALSDPQMLELCAATKCTVCLMHMQGSPQNMQVSPTYENVTQEVKQFLMKRAAQIHSAGIPRDQIWIDPGIGFGKTDAHNLQLLRDVPSFVETGYPVLVGVSRKGFIGRVLNTQTTADRLEGTLATQAWAQIQGAKIIRAHDVKEARRTIDMVEAIRLS